MPEPLLSFGPRLRRSPFYDATRRWGVAGWTVYNHVLMPTHYGDPVQEYYSLIRDVTLWDVAAQRQVEVSGPDARAFLQYLTPRNLEGLLPGRGRYILLTDEDGGVVNDPVLFCLPESEPGAERFWLSAADSDLVLWMKGALLGSGFDARVHEPPAWPLQLQGPKAPDVLESLLGEAIHELRYFWIGEFTIAGTVVYVSRTGWSGEKGYEIYLRDAAKGDRLWEALMDAGEPFNIRPAAPNQPRRIEAGLLSWGADMDLTVSPYDLRLGRFVDLEMEAEFVGKAALRRLAEAPARRQLMSAEIDGPAVSYNAEPWPVMAEGRRVGWLTSAAFSPGLDRNIGLCLVATGHAEPDQVLETIAGDGTREMRLAETPFIPSRAPGPTR